MIAHLIKCLPYRHPWTWIWYPELMWKMRALWPMLVCLMLCRQTGCFLECIGQKPRYWWVPSNTLCLRTHAVQCLSDSSRHANALTQAHTHTHTQREWEMGDYIQNYVKLAFMCILYDSQLRNSFLFHETLYVVNGLGNFNLDTLLLQYIQTLR